MSPENDLGLHEKRLRGGWIRVRVSPENDLGLSYRPRRRAAARHGCRPGRREAAVTALLAAVAAAAAQEPQSAP